jgi:endonuclease YncB( thermonuclease family)
MSIRILISIFFSTVWVASTAAQTVYVIDGDTIEIEGQAIRLEGIDAPELSQICQDSTEKPFKCGLVARRLLVRITKSGKIRCSPTGSDIYGRTLAYCFAGDIEIKSQLVAKGYARAFVRYSTEYTIDESKAKSARLGLWRGRWQAPWQWRAAHKFK